ncbi:hypothetical protein M0657_010576 [Pyricularia oryzae]|nr:hypothetical protein M9X92_010569 [Pyricularia oryzae]KAI7912172.1 hypothetical protein M0657_010576 [Pyricularia oryzae]
MQFSLALYIILPTLVAAVDPPATAGGSLQILPTSNVLCPIGIKCAASSDGTHRCLGLNGRAICATTCPTTSDCPARCKKQTLVNGFCTNGQVFISSRNQSSCLWKQHAFENKVPISNHFIALQS